MLDCKSIKNLPIFLNLAAQALESFPEYKPLLKVVKRAIKKKITAKEVRYMRDTFIQLQGDSQSLNKFKTSKDVKLKYFKLIISEIINRLP